MDKTVTLHDVPDALFVMVQPDYPLERGGIQRTYHAFTPSGIRSRTARTNSQGEFVWMSTWEGERIGWSKPFPYEGETPESMRKWHEHQHQWEIVPFNHHRPWDLARSNA